MKLTIEVLKEIDRIEGLKESKEFSLEYSDKEDIETWISFN